MEIFKKNKKEEIGFIQNESQENTKNRIIKLDSQDSPLKNNNNDNYNTLENIGSIEGVKKSKEAPILKNKSVQKRFSVIPKKDKLFEIEKKKRKSMFKFDLKKPMAKKNKYIRKNAKKNIIRKNRDSNAGGTIKVVGKVSAKLETLIQRLEQNAGNDHISNTRIENKHVIAPKIKAVLEMFNKKKEEQSGPIPFQGTKYKTINEDDVEYEYKNSKKRKKKSKYTQEFNEEESEYEDEEYEDEDEEGYEEDENNHDKEKIKKEKKWKNNLILSKNVINGKIKGNSDKNKTFKNKSEKKRLKFSDDSDSYSDSNNNNNKKRKRRKKLNSSKNSENSQKDDGGSDDNDKSKNKENKIFDFSDEKSKKINIENIKGKRKLHKHKSGKGHLLMNSKSESRSSSSSRSNNSFNSNKKNATKNNPINLLNDNEGENDNLSSMKNDNFSFKEYIVKNYHPKPYIIWKNQYQKYSFSKQIDFSVFALIKKKPKKSIKTILLNTNSNGNDINKRKNNTRQGGRKSVLVSFNNNNLLNLAKRFDINKKEEKQTNIKKINNALMNEKKNINLEYEKKRKRYQSILMTDIKSLNDFVSKLNSNKNSSILKKNNNAKAKKRLSVFQILQKRGLNPTFLENLHTDGNDSNSKKKVKFGRPSIFQNKNNPKNKGIILENIQEKEEEFIKETNDGVKYIVFQKKSNFQKIYKKEKWILMKSDNISIFLKALKPKEIPKEKVINIKNNELEKIYKNKFDGNKIEKIELKYPAEKKPQNKITDLKNDEIESKKSIGSNIKKSESENGSESENNNDINKKVPKEQNLEKDTKKEEKYYNNNTLNKYFFNTSTNNSNNTEIKNKAKLKIINSRSNISEAGNKTEESDYFSMNVNRRYKRGLTVEVRKLPRKYEYILDEQEKTIGKVKSKKAKIKQFKSLRDDPEPVDNERRKKGNLYDYYSSKIPKKKKNIDKYENIDEFSINSKKKKTISNKYEYNYTHPKEKKIKRSNSEQSADVKTQNNANTKKPKIKINTNINIANKKNNSSLVTTYRQQMIEKMQNMPSNKKNNSRNKKEKINYVNQTISSVKRIKENKYNLNSSLEMTGIDAIKSRMKKRLIEINNNLLDAVDYYNGPIDISCISLKNYNQIEEDLSMRALKNGYKCSKIENNLYTLTNQFNSFSVNIVKIRTNMLYYLIVKNE